MRWKLNNNPSLLGGSTIALAVVLGIIVAVTSERVRSSGQLDLMNTALPPGTSGFLLGTDNLGRDVLLRLISAIPWSISVCLVGVAIALLIGVTIGVVAGWSSGFMRHALLRVIDMAISFPAMVLGVVILAVVGTGWLPLTVTLGLIIWPAIGRVVFAEASSIRHADFIAAARIAGVSPGRIIFKHVLPSLRPTLGVVTAFMFADLLMIESALAFLGLGAPITSATWGNMLNESRMYMETAPWMLLAPAAAIAISVVGANLIGDGIATNYRKRKAARG